MNAILIALSCLAVWTESIDVSWPASSEDASKILARYVETGEENRDKALEIVDNGQVIILRYEQSEPSESVDEATAFADSLRASTATSASYQRDGKIYPQIRVVFSRFYGDAKDLSPEQWLDEMRRPIERDYKLQKVELFLTPSPEVVKASFATSREVARTVAGELEKLKSEYDQLQEFTSESLNPGQTDDGDWPEFPHISYQYDIGKNRRTGIEKLSVDWCILRFDIDPITGKPRPYRVPTRKYPKRGIQASWSIKTGDDRLKEEFNRIVGSALKKLSDPPDASID